MIDIHAHLFWDSYDTDRDEVIARAREAGVEQMICVGTSSEDNPQAIAVAERYSGVWAAVGVHPHSFSEESGIRNQESWLRELKKLARHPKVVAIGECGLDYFSRKEQGVINNEQKKIQKEGFLAQIALAQELNLPLIIHTRPSVGSVDAYEEMFEILKNHSSLTRFDGVSARRVTHPASCFVLHCYQGSTEMTKKFLELSNVYFSFAGSITYPVKKTLVGTTNDPAEAVKLVPLERLFVETDCPFLAPQGKRKERNEPAYVRMTAERICALQEVTSAALEAAVDENFKRVFAPRKV